MKKKGYTWLKHFDFVFLDIIILELTYIAAIIWRDKALLATQYYKKTMVLISLVGIILHVLAPFLKDVLKRSVGKELQMCSAYASIVAFALLTYQYLLKIGELYSRAVFLILWFGSIIILFLAHLIYRKIVRYFLIQREKLPKLLLITECSRVQEIATRLCADSENSFQLSGVCVVDYFPQEEDWTIKIQNEYRIKVLKEPDLIFDYIQRQVIDDVLIDVRDVRTIEKMVHELLQMGLNVHIGLSRTFGRLPNQSISEIAGRPVFSSGVQPISDAQLAVKRLMDIVGGVIGLAITGVLFIVFAPIIKKQSPGPVFFEQIRVGKNGRRFRMYKFRSMNTDAEERKTELINQNKMEGLMFKIDDDPRVFPIGHFIRKYSIDEFPQFLNVLKGDMSLVGTRPPTEDEWEQYDPRHRTRLSMKPGITGLWQVSGRSEITDFEEVVALDVKYIREWSIKNDLRILLRTVGVVVSGKGSE